VADSPPNETVTVVISWLVTVAVVVVGVGVLATEKGQQSSLPSTQPTTPI
jgi:hypothetical protein